MRRVGVSLVCWLVLASHAWGYGTKGHQIVGFVAQSRLTSAHARQQIHQLLQPGETLASVSTWADEIKIHQVNDEQREFVAAFPQHATFHYVDLWHDLRTYDSKATGARPDDLVQMLTTCIRVLQGKSTQFSPRIALLLMVHYVGDIHQPLHVGSGYIVPQGRHYEFRNPADRPQATPDRGGNALRISPLVIHGQTKLHAFWDVDAVDQAAGPASAADFARALVSEVRVQPGWNAAGPPDTWPTQWAADALRQADAAYTGVFIGRKRITTDPKKPEWSVTLPPTYLDNAAALVETQLAKGGFRLARLLDAIWP